MCGILVYASPSKKIEPKEFESSLKSINHRGPDSQDFYEYLNNQSQTFLGHRRLSVIDTTSNANQPQHYKDLSIIFNGEIYNYKDIKKELENLNYKFETNSDTEVILKAYSEWKHKAVHKFIGMFAFAILDKSLNKITIYRDRAGVKPLYYRLTENSFYFGSELKALAHFNDFKKDINQDSLRLFFTYGYVMGERTIYKEVSKLLPGHFLEYDISSNQISIEKYWDVSEFYNKPKFDISYEEAQNQLEELLIDSFKLRMVADVPVGVFLSGGYDSSLLTSILKKHYNSDIKTFTIGFENKKFDESEMAKSISDILKTDHHNYTLTTTKSKEILKNLSFYFDEPFADVSSIPSIFLAEKTKEKVTVALSADAGDELFAGYGKHIRSINYYDKFSKFKHLGFAFNLISKLTPSNKIRTIHNLKFLTKNVNNLSYLKIMDNISQKHNKDIVSKILKNKTINTIKTPFNTYNNSNIDSFSKMLEVDYKTYMVDDILVKVDRATMSSSLEGREPFLDHRITEFAAQLPNEYKIKGDKQKRILKDICHKYLPKELMDKPKKGFTIPIFDWLKTDLKDELEKTLSKEITEKYNILDYTYLSKAKKEFFKGNSDYNDLIWYTYIFNKWCIKWL